MSDDDVLGKAYDARLMRRLVGYLRPYRWQVGGAVAAIVGHSALQLVPPYLTKTVIIASHDQLVYGSSVVDRVISMRDGKIEAEGR